MSIQPSSELCQCQDVCMGQRVMTTRQCRNTAARRTSRRPSSPSVSVRVRAHLPEFPSAPPRVFLLQTPSQTLPISTSLFILNRLDLFSHSLQRKTVESLQIRSSSSSDHAVHARAVGPSQPAPTVQQVGACGHASHVNSRLRVGMGSDGPQEPRQRRDSFCTRAPASSRRAGRGPKWAGAIVRLAELSLRRSSPIIGIRSCQTETARQSQERDLPVV